MREKLVVKGRDSLLEESLESGHCCEMGILCTYGGSLEMIANGQLTGGDVEFVVRNFDVESRCKDHTNSMTPMISCSLLMSSVCRRSRQLTTFG